MQHSFRWHPDAAPDSGPDLAGLAAAARRVRAGLVEMCADPPGAHLGGGMSAVEILVTLYCHTLRVDPQRPADPDRDIFVLSKGHAAAALYAVLAERGFLPATELAGYGRSGSRLAGHPTRRVPGVEMPTGSLGHGLSLAVGFALAARHDRRPTTSYCLLGDGELQEGSVWEAAMCAASQELDRLVAIVDRNGLQITGPTELTARLEPLAERWESFGWHVQAVDGHDIGQLAEAFAAVPARPGRPTVLIAQTVKGKGVPFVEGRAKSHFARLGPRQLARARAAVRGVG